MNVIRPQNLDWQFLVDNNGLPIGLLSKGGQSSVYLATRFTLPGNTWIPAPSICRLRLVGTGTLSIDSRDAEGNVTTAAFTATAMAATDQIEFPYFGDDAVDIKATITGLTSVEVYQ